MFDTEFGEKAEMDEDKTKSWHWDNTLAERPNIFKRTWNAREKCPNIFKRTWDWLGPPWTVTKVIEWLLICAALRIVGLFIVRLVGC